MSTTELETKIGDSLRALPMLLQHNVPYPLIEQDDIKNKQEKPPIIKTMDPRFEEIQAVSKPAGFYPEFVKWAVETYGFEKADDSGQTITLSSLPDPRILDKIRFINIVDFRKSVVIARIEIIDYKLPEKAIPYWGFFVSLTKYDYGSDEKELLIHDFFWNTLQRVEDKISVLSGHLIWGPKNGDILQGWEKCEDERSIKEKYGIELGELKSGVSRSYIQVFYQKDNKEESKTLSLRGLERKCKISKWEKSINDICLPTGDSLDEEKPASDGDEEDEDEEDEDKEDEDEEDEDEK